MQNISTKKHMQGKQIEEHYVKAEQYNCVFPVVPVFLLFLFLFSMKQKQFYNKTSNIFNSLLLSKIYCFGTIDEFLLSVLYNPI